MPVALHAKTRSARPPRIGLFGGSFDPAHRGHRSLVHAAMKQLSLDRVYVIPARVSPLKTNKRATSGTHRLAMLRLLFQGEKNVRISTIELRRTGISFTVDTVRRFRRRFPKSELVLIIGEDNLRVFNQWRKPREILRMVSVAVYAREGGQAPEPASFEVRKLAGRLIAVSATEIRDRVKNGRSFTRFVTPEIADYIHAHELYTT